MTIEADKIILVEDLVKREIIVSLHLTCKHKNKKFLWFQICFFLLSASDGRIYHFKNSIICPKLLTVASIKIASQFWSAI